VKTPALFLTFVFLWLAAAHGQSPIRATTRVLPDGSTLTTITDPDAHTRKETIAQTDGKVLRSSIYRINDQNFATAATHFDAKGVVRYKEVYKFDYAGRITESKLYSADNRPIGKRVYILGGADGSVVQKIEDYDANGNLISTSDPGAAPKGAKPEVRKAQPVPR
jgi:hypothetical protein